MSVLIQLRNLHKSYGTLVVLDEASAVLSRRDRVGVIGRNGAGKTTLCRLIIGEEELDSGQVVKSPQLRLNFLEQENPFRLDETVLSFLVRYTRREEWQCGKVAGRFQLKGSILEQPIGDLPGGFQTRVKLTTMLLGDPNFLVLDEPTNYLDLKTLMLLERFLQDFPGGYLVVSHDREFLKRTCDRTLEVEGGRLTLFPGDVEDFLAFKEEMREQNIRYNRNVEATRKHLQRFIDRYRVNKKSAARAQARIKQLEKLEPIEIEHPIRTARIKIPGVETKRGVALRCTDLEIGYPGHRVAGDIHLEIERGEHVAVLGDNGEGKTTFLRTLAGELAPRQGEYRWGHALDTGYYAQHVYTALDPELDVYTHLEREAAPGTNDQDILDMAGSFLFPGDDVRKRIAVLSGGERARVCLAGLLLARRTVLLFDEPTNHLDFETVEALGQALRGYTGTIFFVSHDRTFVSLVATNIVEVKNGSVTLYPGDYGSYVYRTEREIEEDEGVRPVARAARKSAPAASSEYRRRKELRNRIRRLGNEIAHVEERMAQKQKEREALHQHFLDHPTDYSREKQSRVQELERLLEQDETLWLSLQEELESLGPSGSDT